MGTKEATYAVIKSALMAAGQQHLVGWMEKAAAQEAVALIRAGQVDRGEAWLTAEDALANHIAAWLSGDYGETLTPDAVFSHRPVLVHAWAISECILELCSGFFTGYARADAAHKCDGCHEEVR